MGGGTPALCPLPASLHIETEVLFCIYKSRHVAMAKITIPEVNAANEQQQRKRALKMAIHNIVLLVKMAKFDAVEEFY